MNKGAFSSCIVLREWEQQGKNTAPIFPTPAARNRLDPLVERCFETFPPTKKGEGARTLGGKKVPSLSRRWHREEAGGKD